MKNSLWLAILFLLGCVGCRYSGDRTMEGISVRESKVKESWQRNQLSTHHYLSQVIDLAHEKSVIRFGKHRALLTRYPQWVPGLHPRPDAELRDSVVEAYGMGQLSDSEYESLMERISDLLNRWGDQRRILTKERFNLRYPR